MEERAAVVAVDRARRRLDAGDELEVVADAAARDVRRRDRAQPREVPLAADRGRRDDEDGPVAVVGATVPRERGGGEAARENNAGVFVARPRLREGDGLDAAALEHIEEVGDLGLLAPPEIAAAFPLGPARQFPRAVPRNDAAPIFVSDAHFAARVVEGQGRHRDVPSTEASTGLEQPQKLPHLRRAFLLEVWTAACAARLRAGAPRGRPSRAPFAASAR